MNEIIPWWFVVAAKLVLARLPIANSLWRRLGVFRHGKMDQFGYAERIFDLHLSATQIDLRGLHCLEMGPGDSVLTALFAKARGAKQTWLVDAGRFASDDVEIYLRCADMLRRRGAEMPSLEQCRTVDDVLATCDARYLTNGLKGLTEIPTASIDYVFSNAVFEHVAKSEVVRTIAEIRRISTIGAVQSHVIDLRDHIQSSLNNLRFPERIWESNFFFSSGFYTNRIRYSKFLTLFAAEGFDVRVFTRETWNSIPISRAAMDDAFRSCSDDDIRTRVFHVLLRA